MGLFVDRDQQRCWQQFFRVQNWNRSTRKGLRCAAAILSFIVEHAKTEAAIRLGKNSVQRGSDAVR